MRARAGAPSDAHSGSDDADPSPGTTPASATPVPKDDAEVPPAPVAEDPVLEPEPLAPPPEERPSGPPDCGGKDAPRSPVHATEVAKQDAAANETTEERV